jgi:FkbM family methyltransferase
MIEALKRDLEALRAEVGLLRKLALHCRQVDLLDWGGLRTFIYMDDLAYYQAGESFKHSTDTTPRLLPALPRKNPAEVLNGVDASWIEVLAAHMATCNLSFVHFDFGCQYGSGAMQTARLLDAIGLNCPIYAFDCGTAAALVPFTLALNRMERRIHFEPLAIGDSTGFAILSSQIEHSEDCKIVNRLMQYESTSWIVQRDSIDEYVSRNEIQGHLLLKVDTQGAEIEVWKGLERCRRDRLVMGNFEFTPTALETRISPGDWLNELMREHRVLDLHPGTGNMLAYPSGTGAGLRLLAETDCGAFAREVAQRKCGWTDVLLIPRGLPGVDALLRRLTQTRR